MMLDDNTTKILVAVLSGAIPGFFALRQAHRTKKSVELAGSEVTVANWNKLIKNLYSEIDRLEQTNEADRKKWTREKAELEAEIEEVRQTAAKERQAFLEEIQYLKGKLGQLEKRVTQNLREDSSRADDRLASDEKRNNGNSV